MQPAVDLLEAPGESQRVLGHLKTGGGDSAGVGGLGGSEEDLVLLEDLDRLGSRRHVGALGYRERAVLYQRLCAGGVELVLSRAGKRDVAGNSPDGAAVGNKFRVLVSIDIL